MTAMEKYYETSEQAMERKRLARVAAVERARQSRSVENLERTRARQTVDAATTKETRASQSQERGPFPRSRDFKLSKKSELRLDLV